MTIIEALKSAQFVVNNEGQQTGVLLDIQSWEALIDWIETISDTKLAKQALTRLEAEGGRPQQAGWLDWDDISEAWSDEEEVEKEGRSL